MDKGFFDLYFFKNIENSNDKVKEVLKKNDSSRLALFCINQKKGRGRKGRVWKSKVGDLTCSILDLKLISAFLPALYQKLLLFYHLFLKLSYFLNKLTVWCITETLLTNKKIFFFSLIFCCYTTEWDQAQCKENFFFWFYNWQF